MCLSTRYEPRDHGVSSMFSSSRYFLDLDVRLDVILFDCLVSPILNYASDIWGYAAADNIEAVHKKFIRKLLCVNKSTNLTALYGELGRLPMSEIRKINMIKYWIKILNSDESSILRKVYNMLKNDANNGYNYNKQNWAYQIKLLLENIGYANLYKSERTGVHINNR